MKREIQNIYRSGLVAGKNGWGTDMCICGGIKKGFWLGGHAHSLMILRLWGELE